VVSQKLHFTPICFVGIHALSIFVCIYLRTVTQQVLRVETGLLIIARYLEFSTVFSVVHALCLVRCGPLFVVSSVFY